MNSYKSLNIRENVNAKKNSRIGKKGKEKLLFPFVS